MTKTVHFVYVLWSTNKSKSYVGWTVDFDKRLAQHRSGFVKATKFAKDWQVVHIEPVLSRSAAVRRELFFKTGDGRRVLKKILESLRS